MRKDNIELYFSPIELQIVYKLWSGSDKDIFDAKYLYEQFKEYVNKKEMKRLAKLLGVKLIL